jgi:hypothetical protein
MKKETHKKRLSLRIAFFYIIVCLFFETLRKVKLTLQLLRAQTDHTLLQKHRSPDRH